VETSVPAVWNIQHRSIPGALRPNNRVRATNVRSQEISREKTWTKFHDAQNKLMASAWRLLTCSALTYVTNCVRLHSISLGLHSTDQPISLSFYNLFSSRPFTTSLNVLDHALSFAQMIHLR
jgi:hypothetical protein